MTSLIFLTISIGVVFYLLKNHIITVDKLFRPLLVNRVNDEFYKTLSNIKSSPEKDSLVSIVNKYMVSIENDKDFELKANKSFFEELQLTIRDTEIDTNEISRLKDLFNKHLASLHARQKKNPD